MQDGKRTEDVNQGGPHTNAAALQDVNGGKMDGFNQSESAERWAYTQLRKDQLPSCGIGLIDG